MGCVEDFSIIHFVGSDVGLFRVESIVHLDHTLGDIQNLWFSSN